MKLDLTREEQKAILKEALSEYIDKQVTAVGWWAIKGLIALALAGMIYLALIKLGMKAH